VKFKKLGFSAPLTLKFGKLSDAAKKVAKTYPIDDLKFRDLAK